MNKAPNMRDIVGCKSQKGEIGVEVEVEADLIPLDNQKVAEVWRITGDGSLRGNGAEFVLREPLSRIEAKKAVRMLGKAIGKHHNSDRCGVHIHINCQDMTWLETLNFGLLYLAFEDLLVRWCGKEREGNLFCLRAGDAGHILDALANAIKAGTFRNMRGDQFRYASINFAALYKYGSLEFRAMRTPEDFEEIISWFDILCRIKDTAKKFEYPQQIVETMSVDGIKFIQDVLGPYEELVGCPNMEGIVLECIRRIQPIIYVFDIDTHKLNLEHYNEMVRVQGKPAPKAVFKKRRAGLEGPMRKRVRGMAVAQEDHLERLRRQQAVPRQLFEPEEAPDWIEQAFPADDHADDELPEEEFEGREENREEL